MSIDSKILFFDDMRSSSISEGTLRKGRLLYEKESYSEAVDLIRAALNRKPTHTVQSGRPVEEALFLLGWNYLGLRDFCALEDLERTVSSLGIQDAPEWELILIWALGIKGDIRESVKRASKFLADQNGIVHPLAPDFLMIRGHCKSLIGEVDQPILDCEAAFAIFRVQGRTFESGRTASNLGFHYFTLGQYGKALEWLSRAEQIFKDLNLPSKQYVVSLHLGLVHYKQGKFSRSRKQLTHALKVGVEGGWIRRQCFANIALGNVDRMQRDFESARRHITAGYNQAQEMSQAREEALALEFLGDVYRDEGQFTEALRFYARALAIMEPLAPEGDIIAETNRRIGECHILNGEFARAEGPLQKALELTRRQGDRFEEAVTLRVLAESGLASGDRSDAQDRITASCEILEDIGANYELAISRLRHAEILLASKSEGTDRVPALARLNHAWHEATESLKLFLRIDVPWWVSQANGLVKRISQQRVLQEKSDREQVTDRMVRECAGYAPGDIIVFESQAVRQILELCDLYAGNHNPVLIRGETGTGKELIARRLHEQSRRTGKLITVNVAAVSPTLFEREFFGHVKGAFSGADESRVGFAEQAHGGTLFLDEIGELPRELQPKLLRLIQEGSFHAVGDPTERSVDIRLVAASNVDLFEATRRGTFREDLFYRLQVLSLTVPALRDRPDDILPLMRHFLSLNAQRPVQVSEFINPAGEKLAVEYPWPGNVREVIGICQQLYMQVSTAGSARVELGQKGASVLCGPGLATMAAPESQSLDSIRDPRLRLEAALRMAGGNRAEAARLLNVSRSTLYRRMKSGE